MVRLVFRPYTHVRRTICTSVSLQASTRVSPGFAFRKHSSPSFGSQHTCWALWRGPRCKFGKDYFRCAVGFIAPQLAHMLDSLVRVSRRASEQTHKVAFSSLDHSFKEKVTQWIPTTLPCAQLPQLRKASYTESLISTHCFLLNNFKSFDPLFKVLFIFPSRYLFAIGLS